MKRSARDCLFAKHEQRCVLNAEIWGAALGAAGAIGGGILQSNAASSASSAQNAAAMAQLAQQQKQFDQIQQLLAPYTAAGTKAIGAQGDLLGLNGNDAQGAAYAALQSSPAYQALSQSGQTAILQNASATGGLRGGNTQGALAQYQPQLLASLIQQQFGNLGGLTSIGQNAAAGVGNAGMQTGNNITSILGQQGQINAGNALGQANAWGGAINGIGKAIGAYNGFGGSNPFSYATTGINAPNALTLASPD